MEKKKIFGLIVILIIFGCNTVKSTKENDFKMENKFIQQNGLTIPVLTGEREKAPSVDFIKQKIKKRAFLELNGKPLELTDGPFSESVNDTISIQYYVKDNRVYEVMEIIKDKKKDPVDNTKELIFTYFTHRHYFPDGSLKSYRVRLDSPYTDIRVGTWYRFDEQGKILQDIDHEKHFKTSFLDIYKIAKSYKRNCFSISRNISESATYWIIGLCSWEGENLPSIYVIVDDNTGKVVEEINYSQDSKDKGSEYYDAKYVKELYKLFD